MGFFSFFHFLIVSGARLVFCPMDTEGSMLGNKAARAEAGRYAFTRTSTVPFIFLM
jgi:hypothetical protein